MASYATLLALASTPALFSAAPAGLETTAAAASQPHRHLQTDDLAAVCEPGWVESSGKCLKAFGSAEADRKTWEDAEASCNALGGHLASVHNNEELRFVAELCFDGLNPTGRDDCAVGLRRTSPGDGAFVYTDGSSFDPDAFGEHFSGHRHDKFHVEGHHGTWGLLESDSRSDFRKSDGLPLYLYVCQVPPPPPMCQQGWVENVVTGKCLKAFGSAEADRKTWEDAEASCNALGGHLASVHNNEELRFVAELCFDGLNPTFRDDCAVGLRRTSPGDGAFVYTDGSSFDPDAFLSSDALHLTPSGHLGGRHDKFHVEGHYGNWGMLESDSRSDFRKSDGLPLYLYVCQMQKQ